jgi:hypothetical protein
LGLLLVIALRPQTPKHIKGGWSQYNDTSEPVDGNEAQNMVTVQSGFRTRDLSITGTVHNLLLRTFSISKQQKNPHKLWKTYVQKRGRKLPVTSLADFCQKKKKSVKLLAIVKQKYTIEVLQ